MCVSKWDRDSGPLKNILINRQSRAIARLDEEVISYRSRADSALLGFCDSRKSRDLLERVKRLVEIRTHIVTEIEKYISTFSAPQCRKICDLMHQMLPRELRDEVYNFIHKQPLITSAIFYDAWPKAAVAGNTDTFTPAVFADWHFQDCARMWDTRFLGAQMTEEFGHSWFGNVTFTFRDMGRFSRLLEETRRAEIFERMRNVSVYPRGLESLECFTELSSNTNINICLDSVSWRFCPLAGRHNFDNWEEDPTKVPDLSTSLVVLRQLVDRGLNVTISFVPGRALDPFASPDPKMKLSFAVRRSDLTIVQCAERLTGLGIACGPNEDHFLTKLLVDHTASQE